MLLSLFIASTFLLGQLQAELQPLIPVPPVQFNLSDPIPEFGLGIIHGRPAYNHEFPWQATVLSCQNGRCSICGGSLISQQFVLTAGHCALTHDHFTVGLGSNQLFKPFLTLVTRRKIVHERYNPHTLVNDIALIQLPHRVRLTNWVKLVTLATPSIGSLVGRIVEVSGYGKTTDYSQVSQSLNTVNLRIISNDECSRTFGNIHETNICAKSITGRGENTCQGDSGGPLVYNARGRHIQVGVVSFGAQSSCSLGPSGYTRVSSYSRWISKNTGIRL